MAEFELKYAGIALLFEKTDSFEPGGSRTNVMLFLIKRIKAMRAALIFVMLTSAIASLALILNTSLTRVFLDEILTSRYPRWLTPLTITLELAALVTAASSILSAVYLLKMQGKTAMVASARFFRHMLHLPMSFFDQRSIGDLLLRQNENETIAFIFLGQLAPLLINAVMLILYLVIMLKYSVPLTAVGVITIMLNALISGYITKKRINASRTIMADSGKFYAVTVSGIEMIESIKASGVENEFFESWAGFQANVSVASVRMTRINEYLGLIPALITKLADAAVLCLGILLIVRGELTAGALLAFTGFMTAFLTPVMEIIRLGQTIQQARTQMERIEDVMRYPADTAEETEPETEKADHKRGKLSGRVDLESITFGYAKLAPPLIEDFSLHIEPGKWVALVGASGCGKSTVAKLISGLYKPWSGSISFDGEALESIPNNVLRASLGVVDQEIVSFHDTISNNIKLWDDSIEGFEVILACRDAEIHGEVMQRPDGYHAVIEPGGRNFSGGQLQRIEIARVLAQDPTIMILDEATSALDAETEASVIRHIRERGITCIVSAHRLSTIRDCDEIILLENGKVKERGTHTELMELNGAYAQLIRND